jgi:hypothetical protein
MRSWPFTAWNRGRREHRCECWKAAPAPRQVEFVRLGMGVLRPRVLLLCSDYQGCVRSMGFCKAAGVRSRAAKVDANAAPIVDALRSAGCSVSIIAAPGVPDLLVGRGGRTYCLEVKGEAGPKGGTSGRNLTREQALWWSTWQGHAKIVRTPAEALVAVGLA